MTSDLLDLDRHLREIFKMSEQLAQGSDASLTLTQELGMRLDALDHMLERHFEELCDRLAARTLMSNAIEEGVVDSASSLGRRGRDFSKEVALERDLLDAEAVRWRLDLERTLGALREQLETPDALAGLEELECCLARLSGSRFSP